MSGINEADDDLTADDEEITGETFVKAEEGSATERPRISVIPYQWQAHRIIPGCIKPKYASPNRAAFHPWI